TNSPTLLSRDIGLAPLCSLSERRPPASRLAGLLRPGAAGVMPVLLPAPGVPRLQVVADADQHHVLAQPGEPGQALRHAQAPGTVHGTRLGLGEAEAAGAAHPVSAARGLL